MGQMTKREVMEGVVMKGEMMEEMMKGQVKLLDDLLNKRFTTSCMGVKDLQDLQGLKGFKVPQASQGLG